MITYKCIGDSLLSNGEQHSRKRFLIKKKEENHKPDNYQQLKVLMFHVLSSFDILCEMLQWKQT